MKKTLILIYSNLNSKKVTYSESDLIESAKYGYEFHCITVYPEKKFEENCKNNFLQFVESKLKQK